MNQDICNFRIELIGLLYKYNLDGSIEDRYNLYKEVEKMDIFYNGR